jgi:hypothetical protein
MGFFDFLKSDDPEPQLIIENAPPTKRTQRRKKDTTNLGRQLGKDDFELKSGQTTAGKAMDDLKQSGNLDPADIDKIASNLQGQGARRPTTSSINPNLIGDLIDKLNKGEAITDEYKSLTSEQKKELSKRYHGAPAPTRKQDLTSGEMGQNFSDEPTKFKDDRKNIPIPATAPAPAPAPPPEETQIVATTGQSKEIPDVQNQAYSDPIIHDVKEIHPPDEHTVFRSALSGLSIALVEYIKKLDPNVEIALNMMETVGFQLPDVINQSARNVVSQISQISHMDTAGLRGSNDKRIKLRLPNEEHKMLKNSVFYPFIIIAIKFYSITKQINFELDFITSTILKGVLEKYLGLPKANVRYAISLIQNFPNELGEAYLNNRNEVVGMTQSQSKAIEKYIELIKIEYKNYFNEDYMSAVKRTEHGTSTLPEVLNHLDNPKMLNLVYSVMMTIDNFILTVKNNDNVLLGLMGLVYAEATQNGDLVDANIISNSNILGYVYFQGTMPMMGRKDIELESLKQMSKPKNERRLEGLNLVENNEKVSMWEDNMGNAIVTIRGTDHKDKNDIITNFLNFGGSREIYQSRRYLKAEELVEKKQQLIQNTGRGSLKVLGYSLGGAIAMRLGLRFDTIKIKVYNPVISNSIGQKKLFKDLKKLNSNIEFFFVDEDPISVNLKDYRNDFKMTMVKKNKFFTSHSLNNHG